MIALARTEISQLDRLRGLLLGGAVGDALGAPVEFMTRADILARFGPRGITDFAPAYGRIGAITDDTQMTLFTLEGLIRSKVRAAVRGVSSAPGVIDHAYRRWFATQVGDKTKLADLDGWLITVPQLWSRRAPGHTCLSALEANPAQFGAAADNASKGSGAIMRVAPIGLLMRDAYDTGCQVAALTHGHRTGIVAAGWFAEWIAKVGAGLPLSEAAELAWDQCRGHAVELDAALQHAFYLAEDEGAADAVPASLGEGWIAEEAAAIALWCVLTAPDPCEALRLAVNIDGDSDTAGTLVGQALGAALGPGWIPGQLLDQLELVEVMEALAQDAAKAFWSDELSQADLEGWFWERYPGW